MAIPNAATVQTHFKIFNCPSTPKQNRTQMKAEVAPEQNKVGACTDYFIVEGVNSAISADLPGVYTSGSDLKGIMLAFPEKTAMTSVSDGLSNTILLGECAGREDVYRGRVMTPAQTDLTLSNVARARGGAWATNDNPYAIGGRATWSPAVSILGPTIPGTLRINNSNEWGHCFYSFHDGGAVFAFGDGSVRFLSESTNLQSLAAMCTRSAGEVIVE